MEAEVSREERHLRDAEYYEAHFKEFLGRYPEQWVAVFDCQVVAVSNGPWKLVQQLKAKGIAKKVSLLRHMTKEDVIFIGADGLKLPLNRKAKNWLK